ncbi:MAG: DUF4136 domain-containing protein [Alphaproteobacteria bacterium]|nr:DUF4136 domain-containing protein [Alphaproteobacteria bacterium]
MKRLILVAVAAVMLGACASPRYVTSDVTRYHTLPATPAGQTFAIVATDTEQEQSIAFRQFSDQLNAKLTGAGLRQFTGDAGKPDYVATLKYAVSGPSPDVRTRNSSVGIGYGVWNRGWGFGAAWDPWSSNYSNTEQVYSRRVELDIYKGPSWGTANPERVFEGRALSEGLNGQVEPVMPYIIDALFQDFPGASGTTRTVRVEVPPNTDRAPAGRSPSARWSY